MKNKSAIAEQKRAWRKIYQERTCPGYEILFSTEHSSDVEAHKKRCRFCDGKTREDFESWKELGEKMSKMLTPGECPKPAPGQIWSVHKNLGGWDNMHRYVNPPLILILELLKGLRGARVAQIFDAPALALADDVNLENGFGHAQSWNTYSLRYEDLDYYFEQVSLEKVQEITTLARMNTVENDLDENTALYFFRQTELEVGAHMAMQALTTLIRRHEYPDLPDWLTDPEHVRSKVLAFEPRTKTCQTEDALIMLGTMKLPEEMIKKAAADETHQISYNIVTMGAHKDVTCQTGLACLDGMEVTDDAIHVEGWIEKNSQKDMLLAWWNHGDRFVEGSVDRDVVSGYFEIHFADCTRQEFNQGELVMLVIRST